MSVIRAFVILLLLLIAMGLVVFTDDVRQALELTISAVLFLYAGILKGEQA